MGDCAAEAPPSLDDPTLDPTDVPSDSDAASPSHWTVDLRRVVTPTSIAMIASFALVLVIVTFLAGRLRNKAYAYGSVSTDTLRQQPPQPNVLNVRPGGAAGTNAASSTQPPHVAVPAHAEGATPIIVTNPDSRGPTGATPQPADPGRQVGLNYVLVQSYHDKQLADNARQFLIDQGVPCTVELGIPGWRTSYCVVGTDGFTGPGSPDCQAMLQKIRALSPGYARVGSYIAFMPQVVKWKPAQQ